MLEWLFPDERKFFTAFGGVAQRLTTAATLLAQAFDDPARLRRALRENRAGGSPGGRGGA